VPIVAVELEATTVEELVPATLSIVDSADDEVSESSVSVANELALNTLSIEDIDTEAKTVVDESSVLLPAVTTEEVTTTLDAITIKANDINIFARPSDVASTVEGMSMPSIAALAAPSIADVASTATSESVISNVESAIVSEEVESVGTVTGTAAIISSEDSTQVVESAKKSATVTNTVSTTSARMIKLSMLVPTILKVFRWTLQNVFGTLKRYFPIIFAPSQRMGVTDAALPMKTDSDVTLTQAQDLLVKGGQLKTPPPPLSTATNANANANAIPAVSLLKVVASLTQQLPLSRGAASIA